MTSLNPVFTVGYQLEEAVLLHTDRTKKEAKERAEEQLRQKQSIQEYYHSQASMARAMTRLKLSSRYLK